MLSLIAEMNENTNVSRDEINQSTVSLREIVKNLMRAKKQAKQIGEVEIHYLTAIALESAREKMFLQIYENH
jgi:predicted RNA-binding Zn ribbon-like protein